MTSKEDEEYLQYFEVMKLTLLAKHVFLISQHQFGALWTKLSFRKGIKTSYCVPFLRDKN